MTVQLFGRPTNKSLALFLGLAVGIMLALLLAMAGGAMLYVVFFEMFLAIIG